MTATDSTVIGVIVREVFIEAAPDTVFAFFTDPDKMTRWMGVSATLEPQEGGLYLVDITKGNIAKGEYREVLPNSRIAFSFGWDSEDSGVPPGSSLVEIDLEPKDAGTLLRLTHSGLPEPAIGPHTEGWIHYCGRLQTAAAGGDPGLDPRVDA